VPLYTAVGGDESKEFKRQSALVAGALGMMGRG
jgi:hypothetical protein